MPRFSNTFYDRRAEWMMVLIVGLLLIGGLVAYTAADHYRVATKDGPVTAGQGDPAVLQKPALPPTFTPDAGTPDRL